MSSFEAAIPLILFHEGGLVNHKNDPGGATNYGVSLRFLRSTGQIDDYDFDGDGDIDSDDIQRMTKDQACDIYKKHWWEKYGYSRINEQSIATKLFDMAVNMGQSQAVKILQRAIRRITNNTSISADGVLGPMTINALNAINPQRLLEVLRSEQAEFYHRLTDKNPKLAVFEKGWLKRAYA